MGHKIKERLVYKVVDLNANEYDLVKADFYKGEIQFMTLKDKDGNSINVDDPSKYRIIYKKETYLDGV